MDLSVVIVSYNVRAFLEQCLVSGERAMTKLDVEVWVVDNRSVDGSVDMVRRRFPWVNVIANEENVGFSVANNQAIRQSAGRYVLLLNPDTMVREDSFELGVAYADANPKLGGMGVPMFDGTGKFLPESKRGLPTPWAAFCRMSGLYRLAPQSNFLNAYYAGQVNRSETGTIDILSGAYMWMRRDALDQVGLLDEQFFMYGEDIDLSWRLVIGGWQNHYFAETSIIHYKGESTKKGSLNYVMVFYNAMLLFAAKHFEGGQARAFSWMIRMAIYGRAALAVMRRMLSRWGTLIRVGFWTSIWLMTLMWLMQTQMGKQFQWPDVMWQGSLLVAFQLFSAWAMGAYRQTRLQRPFSGQLLAWLVASMSTLVLYSLWPESWRFSRGAVLAMTIGHGLVHAVVMVRAKRLAGSPTRVRRLYVGDQDVDAMMELLRRHEGERAKQHVFALWSGQQSDAMGRSETSIQWVGHLNRLDDAVQIHDIEEVVFSGKDVRLEEIVKALPMLGSKQVRCRIAWTDAGELMSSGGASREVFVGFRHGLHLQEVARTKRVFDLISSSLILLSFPWLMLSGRSPWLRQAFWVLSAKKTWVSAGRLEWPQAHVLEVTHGMQGRAAERKAFTHGQDYHWKKDLSVVVDALISRRAIHSHGRH